MLPIEIMRSLLLVTDENHVIRLRPWVIVISDSPPAGVQYNGSGLVNAYESSPSGAICVHAADGVQVPVCKVDPLADPVKGQAIRAGDGEACFRQV